MTRTSVASTRRSLSGSSRSSVLIAVLCLTIGTLATPVEGHPDGSTTKTLQVELRVPKIVQIPEQSDGLDGNSELIATFNIVHGGTAASGGHGAVTVAAADPDWPLTTWYPFGKPAKVIWDHRECAPLVPVTIEGRILESDNSFDQSLTNATAAAAAGIVTGKGVAIVVTYFGGAAAGPVGIVVGALIGMGIDMLLDINGDDDLGGFIHTFAQEAEERPVIHTTGADGDATDVTLLFSNPNVIRKRLPCIGPITAVLSPPSTTYTVEVDPEALANEDFTFKWTKTGDPCGTFEHDDIYDNVIVWNHPHPPCGDGSHSATITVEVSDNEFTCTATYTAGSNPGTGPAPDLSKCVSLTPPKRTSSHAEGRFAFQSPSSAEEVASTIFPHVRVILAEALEMKRERGNPSGLTARIIDANRRTVQGLGMGFAQFAAAGAIGSAAGLSGVQAAIEEYQDAKDLHANGDFDAAVDMYESAFITAASAIDSGVPGDTGAAFPFHIVLTPDYFSTSDGRSIRVLAGIAGGGENVDNLTLTPSETSAGIDVTVNRTDPTSRFYELDIALDGVEPGEHVITLTATNGSDQATQDLTLVISPEQETCLGREPTIVGSAKDDEIKGSSSPDVILALGGDDRIFGGSGDDLICGGSGNDNIHGDGGDDRLDGGSGTDALDGGEGRNRCTKGERTKAC